MKKLSFLFAALVAGVMSAQAEVLVYEGFGPSDYAIGSGSSDQDTASNHPGISPLVDAIGVGDSGSKWQGMGGSQIKVYGSYRGLDLPEAMVSAGFTAIGGSIGLNNGSNNSDLRAMNHALTASLNRSAGKLYLRMLLCIDSKAAGKLIAYTVYPNCMAVMGPYGSNGGFFRADEIRIGTEITDVLVANADAPALGEISLSARKADGSYDVAIAVAKNAGVVKAVAQMSEGDASPIVVATAAEVSAPNGVTLTLSGFAADKTYQVLAVAENAAGAETNKIGTLYGGALTLTKVKDAREYRCEAGEVLVSRATADPYRLTVNYTLSSSAAGCC